jgi:hypothetical protein
LFCKSSRCNRVRHHSNSGPKLNIKQKGFVMSEQTGLPQVTPPSGTDSQASTPAPRPKEERDKAIYSSIAVCSLCLIGTFFLPWIRSLFIDLSGFQLQQQLPDDEAKFVWIIPLSAVIALVGALTKKSVLLGSRLAGVMPFLALVCLSSQAGADTFKILLPGAYAALALASVLFVAPCFLTKPQS